MKATLVLVPFLALILATPLLAQTPPKEGTATIAGVVTLKGEPARGVLVALQPPGDTVRFELKNVLRAKTDDGGRFRFEKVKASRFAIGELQAIRYRLSPTLPNEKIYVKSILASGAGNASGNAKSAAAAAANDFARFGVAPKQGEKLNGVTITISDGAASLRGKVVTGKGGRALSRVRVHLIPAEPTYADDVLRYAEAYAQADGSFGLTNLAPGKYWMLARAVPEDEPVDRPNQVAAWDAVQRAKLRKEAEAAKVEIELKACHRVTDQLLQFSQSAK